nr:MAG TPA: hypothetical protein [Caudoviricetes sp.]
MVNVYTQAPNIRALYLCVLHGVPYSPKYLH